MGGGWGGLGYDGVDWSGVGLFTSSLVVGWSVGRSVGWLIEWPGSSWTDWFAIDSLCDGLIGLLNDWLFCLLND